MRKPRHVMTLSFLMKTNQSASAVGLKIVV
jgi:hypothetical protein